MIGSIEGPVPKKPCLAASPKRKPCVVGGISPNGLFPREHGLPASRFKICASLEFELLNPMVRGVYLSLKKFGYLSEERGCDLNKIKVSYKSFVHKSHKSSALLKAQESIMFLHNTGLLRSNPELLDNIDADKLVEMLVKSGGAPKEIFKSEIEVKKIRAQREQMQGRQQQMQQQQINEE